MPIGGAARVLPAAQAPGFTFLAGVDWNVSLSPHNSIVVTVLADLAAPVVDPVFDNLFGVGTGDDAGGNNIMGQYRFGIAIGMPM